MGREVRAWPMLALLLVVVLVAIGCVLWFMREAMQNERLAVRQKLAEAYRGHLTLAQKMAEERWSAWRQQLDASPPDEAHFADCVRTGLADSVICFDSDGRIVYPRTHFNVPRAEVETADTLQVEFRKLVKAGEHGAIATFVIEKFADPSLGAARDGEGRVVSANAELMALELIADAADPRFQQIATRLRDRLTDYGGNGLPSAQRRFIMRAIQRIDPRAEFPTLAAEDLAARFLEAHRDPSGPKACRPANLPTFGPGLLQTSVCSPW